MSGTAKSGLLLGAITFLSNLGLGVLLPVCAPLCGIIWGAGAGVLAVVWSEPVDKRTPAGRGARAGAIAGIGAFLGLLIGMIVQYGFLGGQEAAVDVARELSRQFGLPLSSGPALVAQQWVGALLTSCCLGLANVGVLAGVGAASAHLYAASSTR